MNLNSRQRLIVQLALSYALSNLDDLQAAFESEDGDCLDVYGEFHRKIKESEVQKLQAQMQKAIIPQSQDIREQIEKGYYCNSDNGIAQLKEDLLARYGREHEELFSQVWHEHQSCLDTRLAQKRTLRDFLDGIK